MSIIANRKKIALEKKAGLIKPFEMTPSEFVERVLYLKGKPFSFNGYEWARPIYDTKSKNLLLKYSRQTSKSTLLANFMTMLCATNSHFSALYVAPTQNQASTFSKQKLDPVLNLSPFIKEFFFKTNRNNQVYYKRLSNGSDMVLKSSYLDADSIRGISADLLMVDEVQDILVDNLPVIEETLTRSDHKIRLYAGTPKTAQHAIEMYWERSSQNEWMMRCEHCNHWNRATEDNILPEGLGCSDCKKRLNPIKGEWVSFARSQEGEFEGFRVPQIIVPWVPWTGSDGSIISKYKTYSREKFYNEVLALPYDNASCPVTLQDVMEACDPYLSMASCPQDIPEIAGFQLMAGVDWGTSKDDAAFTVLTIGTFLPGGQFLVIYAKRYRAAESDPIYQVNDIADILTKFNVTLCGCDWGFGMDKNRLLATAIGDSRVIEFNNSGMQKQAINFNRDAGFYTINRTLMLSEMFNGIKQKRIVFPKWEESEPFLEDALHVYQDYRENMQAMFYSHAPNKPDDFMHSLMYAYLSGKLNLEL